MITDVIVIGGGASGLVAAICAARRGKTVTILEHKDKIGKKILATGNGKCNYTNKVQNLACYRGSNPYFVEEPFKVFDVSKTLIFFKELGIIPFERNGYYYPKSKQASSILEVLSLELSRLKVKVKCLQDVHKVEKTDHIFKVYTDTYCYEGNNVILATGGCASMELGSDGSGFTIAKGLGHSIIEPVPALVSLKAKANYFSSLAGVRCDANVSLYIEDKLILTSQGELQLASYGVSGIPIFEISTYASRGILENKNVYLFIDLLSDMSVEDIKQFIKREENDNKTVVESLVGILNKKVITTLLKVSHVDMNQKVKDLTDSQWETIIKCFKEFKIDISEPNNFASAQVSAGGVSTEEVNNKTMESTLVEGLYITGELLDIDGTCGGYNLQWAWTSGYIAGTSVR